MKDVEIVVFQDKSWVRLKEYQKVKEENEQLKQRIGKARITLEIFENTEDNFEEVLCLEQLKELLGDTNDKI